MLPIAAGAELLRFVSLIHVLPGGAPALLVVDDLHALADLPAGDRPRPRDMALCRILAALHEAVVSTRHSCLPSSVGGHHDAGTRCSASAPCPQLVAPTLIMDSQDVVSQLKGSPCQLLVSETSHADGPRLLYILQRWLPLVLHIRREPDCCAKVRGM